jgi:hypothetical protein
MSDDVRRARLLKEFQLEFLPDYDVTNMPAADKRAAYALEHIAFRMSRIDKKLDEFMTMVSAMLVKA